MFVLLYSPVLITNLLLFVHLIRYYLLEHLANSAFRLSLIQTDAVPVLNQRLAEIVPERFDSL